MGSSKRTCVSIGDTFGRLTVQAFCRAFDGSRQCVCSCVCGGTATVAGKDMRSGNTTSCGCLRLERLRATCVSHGERHSGTYNTWSNMHQRCTNPKHPAYVHYGGRGIKVDSRWEEFAGFLNDMGGRPATLTLDRVDVNGDYTKANCRWTDWHTQARNRRNSRFVEVGGQQLNLVDAARAMGISPGVLHGRLARQGSVA